MAIVNYTSKERDMLARLMRAEAIGEGNLGMLMVGNVGINRVIASCLTFKNVRTISDMIYQSPGGFSSINSPLFFSNPTTTEQRLADRILNGEKFNPASNALWFYAPGMNECSNTWWEQDFAGKYKNHCFYKPNPDICSEVY